MAENNKNDITEFFNLFDKHSLREFSKQKLKTILENSTGQKVPDEEFDKLMEEMDVDDNGNISITKFLSTMFNKQDKENVPLSVEGLGNMFSAVGKGKLEQIGVEDWQNVLKSLGINLSEFELNKVMNIATDVMKQIGGLENTFVDNDTDPTVKEEDSDNRVETVTTELESVTLDGKVSHTNILKNDNERKK